MIPFKNPNPQSFGPKPGGWAGGGPLMRAGQRSAENRYKPEPPLKESALKRMAQRRMLRK